MAPPAKKPKGSGAYMLFSEEKRPELLAKLRAEAPDGKVAVTAVAKALGELWKGLTDEEKAAYKEQAQQRAAEAAAAAAEAANDAADEQQPQQHDAAADPSTAAAAADPGLPKGSVKRIMLLDPDVQRVSADAVWLVGEATRLFLQQLGAKGAAAVVSKKRKTLMLQDFDQIVRTDRRLVEAGMKDIMQNKGLFFGTTAAAAAAKSKQPPTAAAATLEDNQQQQEQDDEQQQQQEEELTDEQRVALAEEKQKKAAAAAKVRAVKAAERQAAKLAAEAASNKRITSFFVTMGKKAGDDVQAEADV